MSKLDPALLAEEQRVAVGSFGTDAEGEPLVAGIESADCCSTVTETGGHGAACFASGGFAASVYILSSLSLGIGVFALPAAVKLTGIGLGLGLLGLFAVTSAVAQILVLDAARQLGCKTYDELVHTALGRPGWVYLNLALAITLLTGNCAHVQTVAGLLGDLLIWFVTGKTGTDGSWQLETYKKAVVYMFFLVVALPLCFLRRLNSLRYASTSSVLTVIITACAFGAYCVYLISRGDYAGHSHSADMAGSTALSFVSTSPGDFFRACGAFCFTFSSVCTLFPVAAEMRQPERAERAVWVSTVVCLVIYCATAAGGALAFGSATKDNCLYNVHPDDRGPFRPLVFALVVFIVLLYPVINYPFVTSVESLVFGPGASSSSSRGVISVLGAGAVVAIDLGVPNLVDLFGLCGALGLGSVSYVIPCLVFLAVDRRPLLSTAKVAAIAVLLLGVTVSSASTFFVMKHIVS